MRRVPDPVSLGSPRSVTVDHGGFLVTHANGSAVLNRVRNVASVNFDRITQNLSPRIFRVGVRVGF